MWGYPNTNQEQKGTELPSPLGEHKPVGKWVPMFDHDGYILKNHRIVVSLVAFSFILCFKQCTSWWKLSCCPSIFFLVKPQMVQMWGMIHIVYCIIHVLFKCVSHSGNHPKSIALSVLFTVSPYVSSSIHWFIRFIITFQISSSVHHLFIIMFLCS